MEPVSRPVWMDDFTPFDQAEVKALVVAGLAEHWGAIDPDRNPDLDDIAATHRQGRVVVVRDEPGGPIIATGTLLVDTGPDPGNGVGSTGQIARMSVAAGRRRAGLGRAVVDELIGTARSRGLSRLVLETTTAWHEVANFYRACGFEVVRQTPTELGPITWFELDL